MKYIAVDAEGHTSKVYTQTYIIDTIAPKLVSTSLKNGTTGVSRTNTISIKFSENIKTSTNWTKIYIKNLNTGKVVGITVSISSNTLNIKMKLSRIATTIIRFTFHQQQ